MSVKDTMDLLKFLKPFSKEAKDIFLWLREFVWKMFPEANELIYDNYNALAIGWSVDDKMGNTFCTMAIFRTNQNVHFGFYRGHELADTEKILLGKGNQYRYVLVNSTKDFPKSYLQKLMVDAYANALARMKNKATDIKGLTITKSVSAKKRVLKKSGKK